MTSSWKIIDSGTATAQENMAADERLLAGLSAGGQVPILHLYDWINPCATYGHFIDPFTLLCRHNVDACGLQLARRPTGGGLIFHLTDWAFSIVVPAGHPGYSMNTLENYAFVNNLVIEVIKRFSGEHAILSLLSEEPKSSGGHERHFCMAKPTRYDVMLDGRKVGGGAQRRTRFGFLHQGTISLAVPHEELLDKLLLSSSVKTAMFQNACVLLPGSPSPKDIAEARKALAQAFISIMKGHQGP